MNGKFNTYMQAPNSRPTSNACVFGGEETDLIKLAPLSAVPLPTTALGLGGVLPHKSDKGESLRQLSK